MLEFGMSTLRITLTEEIQQVLALLQINFPTLSQVEITKLALGELQKKTAKRKAASLSDFMNGLPRNEQLSDEESMAISIQAVNGIRGKE